MRDIRARLHKPFTLGRKIPMFLAASLATRKHGRGSGCHSCGIRDVTAGGGWDGGDVGGQMGWEGGVFNHGGQWLLR